MPRRWVAEGARESSIVDRLLLADQLTGVKAERGARAENREDSAETGKDTRSI